MSQRILEAYARCLQRYPTVHLQLEDFCARVETVVLQEAAASGRSRAELLSSIHCEDLFLALACSRNDRIAWEHFAEIYMPLLRRCASIARGNESEGEDLAQEVFTKMLQERERLSGYNGRGTLAGWLRVMVAHAAIDRFRRMRKQVSLEELQGAGDAPVLRAPGPSEADDCDRRRWMPVVSEIANRIISGLPARDRLALGLYHLNGVTLKQLGRQFGMHEATASRWLERLRSDIRSQVEREMRKKHGLQAREVQSLWTHISAATVVQPIAAAASESGLEMAAGSGKGRPKITARGTD